MNPKQPSSFTGEQPTTSFAPGRTRIHVELIDYPDEEKAINTCFQMLVATWGEVDIKESASKEERRSIVEESLKGNMLGNCLEALNYTFSIDGISRATTHQLVRTRIGAAFAQHGGRDNDWRHRDVRIPDTIQNANLTAEYTEAVLKAKEVYAKLVDAGVPWQDSRYILPIGTMTYILATYTYRALQNLLNNRLCLSQTQWELCYVAWKMREAVQKVTPLFGKYLTQQCERTGYCGYAEKSVGVHLFEPCGYQPVREGVKCKWHFSNNQNGSMMPVPIYEEINQNKTKS